MGLKEGMPSLLHTQLIHTYDLRSSYRMDHQSSNIAAGQLSHEEIIDLLIVMIHMLRIYSANMKDIIIDDSYEIDRFIEAI